MFAALFGIDELAGLPMPASQVERISAIFFCSVREGTATGMVERISVLRFSIVWPTAFLSSQFFMYEVEKYSTMNDGYALVI
jgi:hypothetical protein